MNIVNMFLSRNPLVQAWIFLPESFILRESDDPNPWRRNTFIPRLFIPTWLRSHLLINNKWWMEMLLSTFGRLIRCNCKYNPANFSTTFGPYGSHWISWIYTRKSGNSYVPFNTLHSWPTWCWLLHPNIAKTDCRWYLGNSWDWRKSHCPLLTGDVSGMLPWDRGWLGKTRVRDGQGCSQGIYPSLICRKLWGCVLDALGQIPCETLA